MKPLEKIIDRARQRPCRIVLSEGDDPRIVAGAIRADAEGIARIMLLGDEVRMAGVISGQGGDPRRFGIEDPARSGLTAGYAEIFHEMRRARGVDTAAALRAVSSPLYFAAMMVRQGEADGCIGGAISTTADTVRAALQVIGRAPSSDLVSSFFLMMLCEPHHVKKGAFVFADCGMVVEPDAGELAQIALSSARSHEMLTGTPARVAMLSFSSKGSASHERVTKVATAVELARAAAPGLAIEGELQFDAAFIEAVSAAKTPGSALKGSANVFVFPNLEAANISYKIAQRIGGALAIGPFLQGLARPANDLSRGCSAEDVFHLIAVTVAQAAETG